jgi:hypothetical protein
VLSRSLKLSSSSTPLRGLRLCSGPAVICPCRDGLSPLLATKNELVSILSSYTASGGCRSAADRGHRQGRVRIPVAQRPTLKRTTAGSLTSSSSAPCRSASGTGLSVSVPNTSKSGSKHAFMSRLHADAAVQKAVHRGVRRLLVFARSRRIGTNETEDLWTRC